MTYAQAKAELLSYLAGEGWTVCEWGPQGRLKYPHATLAGLRLTFRAQAVYASLRPDNGAGELSLHVDTKQTDGPALVASALRMAQFLYGHGRPE